jgi:hypothetical protein
MSVATEFRNLAMSFYGCDGGNLDSPIWTCGLEWGGGLQDNEIPQDDFMNTAICSWDSPGWSARGCLSGRRMGYNQKLAWFFSYYFGWDIHNYKQDAEEQKLFCKNGIGFKMNAFPISFKDRRTVTWNEAIMRQTGLNDFDKYREWCIENRGRYYYDLVKKHSPKLVLCTGIDSYKEFFRFFRCDEIEPIPDNYIYVSKTNSDKTLVFVVPFFGGPYGINSYKKMENLVVSVKKRCFEHFGSEDWISKYIKRAQIQSSYGNENILSSTSAQFIQNA